MTVVESAMNGVSVVASLSSRLDAAGCGEFRRRVEEVLGRGQARVVLDLSAVTFIDSTGLSIIIGAVRSLTGTGRLACAGLGRQPRALFEVTKLDRGLVDLFETVEEAVDALGAEGGRRQ